MPRHFYRLGKKNIKKYGKRWHVIPQLFFLQTSTGQSIPPFCGENAGQHSNKDKLKLPTQCLNKLFFSVYIDIGANSGDSATIQFAFNTPAGTTALARLWDVKVTQIECSNGNA